MSFEHEISRHETPSPLDQLDDSTKRALAGATRRVNPADTLAGAIDRPPLPEDLRIWAEAELHWAINAWSQYDDRMTIPAPKSLDELIQTNPNLTETLTRLRDAQIRLEDSAYFTSSGLPLDTEMNMVLIPWAEFHENHNRQFWDLSVWLDNMTERTRPTNDPHFLSDTTVCPSVIATPIYRDDDAPHKLLTTNEYLQKKLQRDGPWGVMLIQHTPTSGIYDRRGSLLYRQSPAHMTGKGSFNFNLDIGLPVDKLGYLEFYAFTMQSYANSLYNFMGSSWCLANRIEIPATSTVTIPHGHVMDIGVTVGRETQDTVDDDIRIRMAVS